MLTVPDIFYFSEKREEISKIKDSMRERGLDVPADKPASSHFDSNCITPVSNLNEAILLNI